MNFWKKWRRACGDETILYTQNFIDDEKWNTLVNIIKTINLSISSERNVLTLCMVIHGKAEKPIQERFNKVKQHIRTFKLNSLVRKTNS